MGFIRSFREYVSGKSSLAKLDMKKLRRQFNRLNVREREIERDMKLAERERQRVLADYARAKARNDQMKMNMLARRFEETKPLAKQFDKRHTMLIKERRVVTHLNMLKEHEDWLAKAGAKKWLDMDVGELQLLIEDATGQLDLQGEGVDELLKRLEFQYDDRQSSPETSRDTMDEMDHLLQQDAGDQEIPAQGSEEQILEDRPVHADVEREIAEIDSLLTKTRSPDGDRS